MRTQTRLASCWQLTLLDRLVLRVRRDLRVSLERLVLREDQLDRRASRDLVVLREDLRVRRASRDLSVFLDRLVLRERRVLLDRQVWADRRVRRASSDRLDLREFQASV